ncbi:MAG: chorismate-binding protein [Bdellovibrio sp.]
MRHRDQWILVEGPFRPVTEGESPEMAVFAPDFYSLAASRPWKGARVHRFSRLELQTYCETFLSQQGPLAEVPLEKAPWDEPAKADFAVALEKTRHLISDGVLQKTVPVVFSRSLQSVTSFERALMLRKLLDAPPSLHVYGFWQNGEGFLGATPEVLFDYSQGVLRTMALAGTCPKNEKAERLSLLEDVKEMQEHQFVVEDLKHSLSGLGEVKTEGPHIFELPTLYHLKTDIEVQCRQKPGFLSLIHQLHPTPALGVAPRSAGYQWMASFPGQEGRRQFGGPFAFWGAEEAVCLVAIRNLQWNKDSAQIGSGCGVVASSELEREWRELSQKRFAVRKILGLRI